MVVRELLALIGFKVDKKSQRGVDSAMGALKKAALSLAAIFASGKLIQGINNLVVNTAKLGDQIAKTSKQIGVNAQALQELQFAANLAGASNQDVSTSLRILQKSALEASDGVKSYQDDFRRLGVTVTDGNGQLKSAEQLLIELSDGFQNLSSDTERTALAQTLLGRSGTKLIPLLNQGTAAIEAQRKRARELGEIYDSDLLKASEDLVDAERERSGAFRGLANIVGKILIPIWTESNKLITRLAITMRGPLTRAVKIVVAIFSAVGNILLTVAKGWILISDLVVQAARDYLGINQTLTRTVIIIAALAAILGLPVVLLGLIGAAIALIIDDFITMGEGGESVTGTLIQGFSDLVDSLGGVGAAIQQVLANAIEFWLEALGVSEGTAEKIADAIIHPFDKVLELFTIIRDTIAEILSGDTLGKIADLAGDFFGSSETPAGRVVRGGGIVDQAAAVVRPTGANSTINNSPNTSVDVTVNAAGGDPQAVGAEVARQVEIVLENERRQTLQQLTTQGAG